MERVIYLYKSDSLTSEVKEPFPSFGSNAIHEFKYTAQRMGSAPSITCTLRHDACIEEDWTLGGIVYAEFNGEKFILKKTPTYTYDNTSSLYKYDLTLVSERYILENVYFFDVVTSDDGDYRPISHGTSVPFFGTIYELAKRINMSLRYSKLQVIGSDNIVRGYSVVVDTYEPQHAELFNTGYLIAVEDKFLINIIQECYNTFKIPYYFEGKTIHIGFGKSGDIITESDGSPFQYGIEHSLLSIKKQNTNNKIVNRISGIGSSDNIPYYYPNETERGDIALRFSNTNITDADVVKVDSNKLIKVIGIDKSVQLVDNREIIGNASVQASYRKSGEGYVDLEGVLNTEKDLVRRFDIISYITQKNVVVEGEKANKYSFILKLKVTAKQRGYYNIVISRNNNDEILSNGTAITFGELQVAKKVSDKELVVIEQGNGYRCYNTTTTKTIEVDFGLMLEGEEREYRIYWSNSCMTKKGSFQFQVDSDGNAKEQIHCSIKSRFQKNVYDWKAGDNVSNNLGDFGISLTDSKIADIDANLGKYVGITITPYVKNYIYPQKNLMPSIYRETNGDERFYNAENDKYFDEDGNDIFFPNEYVEGKPSEHIEKFDDIKPTIVGMTNSKGQRFDTFLDFAYDYNDSDEVDEAGKYIHPYFYAKLPKYDGEFGFNLFDHAIDESEMTISMTSGTCGACQWVIAVDKNLQQNRVQVDDDGNIKRDTNGNVLLGAAQDRQNDTKNYEVWIALKKEYSSFGVVMPNASYNYKPNVGDTFVILHIELPKAYILAAEKRLENSLIQYMKDNNEEKFSFSVSLSRIFLEENPTIRDRINENSMISIENYGKVYALYISSFTYNITKDAALPEITIDVKDSLSINSNAIENAVNNVKMNIVNLIEGIDFSKEIAAHYLNKEINDHVSGLPTFHSGLKSEGDINFGNFAQGASGAGIYKDGNGNWHIESDFINVRKKFTASSVELQEAKHIGGELILSAANCKISIVEEHEDFYRCYFAKTDSSGNKITNNWQVDDQAYCRFFNCTDIKDVKDRWYWRLVVGVSKDNDTQNIIEVEGITINISEYHYIDISKSKCAENSDIPIAGDNIIQLGHQGKDTNRRNATVIRGAGEGSPYIREYTNIETFSLDDYLDTQLKPNDNILSGKTKFVYYKDGIKQEPKSLEDLNNNVDDLGALSKEISDAIDTTKTNLNKVQETISKLEYGKVNMLLNSGFTGDYLTSNLDSSSSLNADTKMFSPSLKYWECDKNHVSVEEYEYSQSGAKVNIEAGYSISQTIPFQVHSGENYIFSFRGVGGDIYITIGGVTLGASMSNTWARYVNSFVAEQDTKIITIHATNTCSLCELQLEKGTIVSAWDISPLDNRTELARYEQLTYLQNILKSHTDIDGGIVSTGVVNSGLISMGNFNENGEMTSITAGLSGTYNTDNDPAFFAGGDMTKAISAVAAYMDNPNYEPTEEELRNMANVVITHGGRAILNDIILRGYVHALGGIFKGRVEASEGEFHGKVYAEAGVFNGTIQANSGSILNEDKQNLWSFDINIDSRDFTIKGPDKVKQTNTSEAATGAEQKEYVSIGKFVTQENITEESAYSICPQIIMRSYGRNSKYAAIVDPYLGYRVAVVDETDPTNIKTIETILNTNTFEFGGNRVIFANIPTKAQVDKYPSSYAVGTLYNDNGTLKIKES